MATVRKMIQMYVDQEIPGTVTNVGYLYDAAGIFLDPSKKAIVREITIENLGGVMALSASGVVPLDMSDRAYAELRMLPVTGERTLAYMYAPTSVESPEILKSGGALLRMWQPSYTISSPGRLAVSRLLAAHAYIDEVD